MSPLLDPDIPHIKCCRPTGPKPQRQEPNTHPIVRQSAMTVTFQREHGLTAERIRRSPTQKYDDRSSWCGSPKPDATTPNTQTTSAHIEAPAQNQAVRPRQTPRPRQARSALHLTKDTRAPIMCKRPKLLTRQHARKQRRSEAARGRQSAPLLPLVPCARAEK